MDLFAASWIAAIADDDDDDAEDVQLEKSGSHPESKQPLQTMMSRLQPRSAVSSLHAQNCSLSMHMQHAVQVHASHPVLACASSFWQTLMPVGLNVGQFLLTSASVV